MKKDSLLKMKDLPATEEMLAMAREDVPVKVGSGWNTSYRCRYSGFVRSAVRLHGYGLFLQRVLLSAGEHLWKNAFQHLSLIHI